MARIVGLALIVAVTGCSDGDDPLPVRGDFTTISDLVYVSHDTGHLRLDLYLPDQPVANPMPVVVMVRGGGFRSTDKAGFGPLAGGMADRGVAAASIEYRGSAEALFPGATEDTKAAVRWLRANADSYGLDADTIVLMGGSAGGYLVAYHGVTDGLAAVEGNRGNTDVSSAVQGIIALAPESGPSGLSAWTEYLGETDGRDPEQREFASALTHIDDTIEPPLLLMHSPRDDIVPFSESERLLQAYQDTGNDAELIRVELAPHAFWFEAAFFGNMMDRAAAFVRDLTPDR